MIPPIVSDAGERARACCQDDSSGGAVQLDWGALDTAFKPDSVGLFDIVKDPKPPTRRPFRSPVSSRSKTCDFSWSAQWVATQPLSGASRPRPH